MKRNSNPRIWEFDVDDTLFSWNLSEFDRSQHQEIQGPRGRVVIVPNQKNINLLIKLAKIGWYIRVQSGSGVEWACTILEQLGLEDYVDEVEAKPLGNTDDQGPGDGLAYRVFMAPE